MLCVIILAFKISVQLLSLHSKLTYRFQIWLTLELIAVNWTCSFNFALTVYRSILHRRKFLRSCLNDFVMNTNSVWDISHSFLIYIPFHFIFFRAPETKHRKVVKRRSTPITGNEILAVKQNSKEFEKRALESKKRIEDTKKKYNLKGRDYNVRAYVWNEEDEKQAKKEREQRKLLRQQIRIKYNLPTQKFHRTAAVVSGWRGGLEIESVRRNSVKAVAQFMCWDQRLWGNFWRRLTQVNSKTAMITHWIPANKKSGSNVGTAMNVI